eukprot:6481165-Amphidinium_carterae.3
MSVGAGHLSPWGEALTVLDVKACVLPCKLYVSLNSGFLHMVWFGVERKASRMEALAWDCN